MTHEAALTAPRANVSRLWARWVISNLSPIPPNTRVCSATTAPARTANTAISFRVRSPTIPRRPSPPAPSRLPPRAGGGALLGRVVVLAAPHVVAAPEHAGDVGRHPEHQVHPHAHVGGKNACDRFRRGPDLPGLFLRQAGAPDPDRLTGGGGLFRVRDG